MPKLPHSLGPTPWLCCQKYKMLLRWPGNRFGPALVAATTKIIVLAWVGWWANKRWQTEQLWGNWWQEGARKMPVLGQYEELEAHFWLILKLEQSCIQWSHLKIKSCPLKAIHTVDKCGKVPKLHHVVEGQQIMAKVRCPTDFFYLSEMGHAQGAHICTQTCASQATSLGSLLGLIMPKPP